MDSKHIQSPIGGEAKLENTNLNTNDRPLVTFMLIAYNQERYIREAVEGAFAQTYTPLEIILSDDCSTDRTFEIMKEMAAQYRGPHKVILNRNERNFGICGHVNRCVELTQGELIVCAAGDDISLPERTSRIMDKYIMLGKLPSSIFSNAYVVGENKEIKFQKYFAKLTKKNDYYELARSDNGYAFHIYGDPDGCFKVDAMLGATHAFNRDLFRIFGNLDHRCKAEDQPLLFRSNLLGGVSYIDTCLIKYRRHPNNTVKDGANIKCSEDAEYLCKLFISIEKQKLRDLSIAIKKKIIDKNKERILRRNIHDTIQFFYYNMYEVTKKRKQLIAYCFWILLTGINKRKALKKLITAL